MKENLKMLATVTKIKSEKSPDLKGLASVIVGGIKIDNIRVNLRECQNKQGEREKKLFVDFPQHKRQDQNGEVVYKDIVSFGRKGEEAKGRDIKRAIINTVLEAFYKEEKTAKVEKTTDFSYDTEFVSSYISPVNSENIQGVGTVYYGGIISISPVFLKEVRNKETGEKATVINLESRQDKNGNYKEVAYPIEKGLRAKMIKACSDSLEKNQKQEKESEIENSDFYQEIENENQEGEER